MAPQVQNQRQEAQIARLREEAQNALASGDYDRAVLAFNELLRLQPEDPQALEGLEQANELRATASLYSEAIIEMEAHHWETALTLLQQIEGEQPGYRDVAERISFIEQQQELSSRFSEAEQAFNLDDYQLAIRKYEALQALDYGFQRQIVQERLFLSYLQLGLAKEAAAGNDPEQLQAALDILEKALSLRPQDSQARGESQLLRLYLTSLDEFEAQNWSQVVSDLVPVYEARPDFAGGAINQILYESYVAWGDELFAEEQFQLAQEQYEKAQAIRGVDTAGLTPKIAQVKEALATPTPTPTAPPVSGGVVSAASVRTGSGPAPTATPVPLPFTVKRMMVRNNCTGSGYIHGVVTSAYDMPLAGVTVQATNVTKDIGPLTSNPSNGDGIYQIILNGDQIEGLWAVQILDDNGQPASQGWGQRLGGECLNGAQELKVDWQRALQLGE
jgi:tetratricopeptide (TPR) repeat protein